MVPRSVVVAVSVTAGSDQVERAARASGRSRLPVIGDDLDDIRGVVHVKDLLLLNAQERTGVTAASLARPAVLAAETEAADDLLLRMRQGGHHLVLVVDEHGGIAGLVTFEDLVEELIGDFDDETDIATGDSIGGGVPGSLRLDELERATGLRLRARRADTLAGWVLEQLHRLAVVGDDVRAGGVRARVLEVDGSRIVTVLVEADDEQVPSGRHVHADR